MDRVSEFSPVGPKAKWAVAGFGAQLLAALTAVFSMQRQVERAAVLSDLALHLSSLKGWACWLWQAGRMFRRIIFSPLWMCCDPRGKTCQVKAFVALLVPSVVRVGSVGSWLLEVPYNITGANMLS